MGSTKSGDPIFTHSNCTLLLDGSRKNRDNELYTRDLGDTKMNKRKLLQKILAGSKNIRFGSMVSLVEAFGFRLARTEGSHHIFVHPEVAELVNLQDVNGQAKPYQIRQFLRLVERYRLEIGDD
jgi:predicted RNA binding protein YcfA (HicA-like mRNA interferase family)